MILKNRDHFSPHVRKISSVSKLIMIMNSLSKKVCLQSQTAIKDSKNNSNHDREELLEESKMNYGLNNRQKMLMSPKFSELPFVLRYHFQKNNIPRHRYLDFIKSMDNGKLNELIPRESH